MINVNPTSGLRQMPAAGRRFDPPALPAVFGIIGYARKASGPPRARDRAALSYPLVPAKAGTQGHGLRPLDSRFRGNERSLRHERRSRPLDGSARLERPHFISAPD